MPLTPEQTTLVEQIKREHQTVEATYVYGLSGSEANEAHRNRAALMALIETLTESEKHCETCICGKRAPVQAERGLGRVDGKTMPLRGAGTVEWAEYLEAYSNYAVRYGRGQTADRLAERGGFSYWEITEYLGHEPKTWKPR